MERAPGDSSAGSKVSSHDLTSAPKPSASKKKGFQLSAAPQEHAGRDSAVGDTAPVFRFGEHTAPFEEEPRTSSGDVFSFQLDTSSPVGASSASALSPGSGYNFGSPYTDSGQTYPRSIALSGSIDNEKELTGEHWPTPEWARSPENNMVLEIRKDGRMIDMIRVDKKNCYRFGRNTRLGSDICVSVYNYAFLPLQRYII